VAVDAVFDSVSVGTTFKAELAKAGVIFCPISEAIRDYPELVKKYLGSVVPQSDNFFATLNSAVFRTAPSSTSPKACAARWNCSTYFRINAENTGQFERTLIIADKGLCQLSGRLHRAQARHPPAACGGGGNRHPRGCRGQIFHRAELVSGRREGRGGIYNFVTKRADCRGDRSKVMWTQVETGSAITWKYPSCILRGDDSQGEFYSIAIANNAQQADTGTKMIHLGKRTKSRIVSKGISAGRAQNTYRGLVSMHPKAKDSRNYTQCDSLLIGDKCGAHTVPYIEVRNNSSRVEHEATTSKVDEDQLFYCRSRGMDEEEAVALVVNGFCKEVLQALPMEFAMEAQSLVAISLEGRNFHAFAPIASHWRRDRAVVARAGALPDLPAGRLARPADQRRPRDGADGDGRFPAGRGSEPHRGAARPGPALAQTVGRGLRDAVLPQFRASLAACLRGDLLADLGGQDHRDDRAALAVLARNQLSILTRMVATLRPRMEAAGG
jgi:Fe-S cluster assembly protein SufB